MSSLPISISALDQEDVETLKSINECEKCDLEKVDLKNEDLSGAILNRAMLSEAKRGQSE